MQNKQVAAPLNVSKPLSYTDTKSGVVRVTLSGFGKLRELFGEIGKYHIGAGPANT